MMRRIAILMIALGLCLTFASAEGEGKEPLAGEEVRTCIRDLTAMTDGAELLTDPVSEEGINVFIYGFATFYTAEEALTPESAVAEVTLMDEELTGPRGTRIDMTVDTLIAALPGENPTLAGTYTDALMYLEGTPVDYRFGRVLRDGQRITAVELGETVSCENGTVLTGVVYNISGDGVDSIHLYDRVMEFGETAAFFADMDALRNETGYSRVPVSFDGLSLTPFGKEDLNFAGRNWVTATPEDLLTSGSWEDGLVDNEDGTFLRIMNGDNGIQAIFLCDAQGGNAVLQSVTLNSDEAEGPRCVRLGDSFSDVFNRFRNGENAFDENGEILYGVKDQAPWGFFLYNDGDGITLRYVTDTETGRTMELYLHFTDTLLTQIILHTL